jgi:hypothetical protein
MKPLRMITEKTLNSTVDRYSQADNSFLSSQFLI